MSEPELAPGRFVVFEGGDACGKSTQARLLADRLDAVLTHEPGGTTAGAAIRAVVLEQGRGDLGERAEALLMAADRAQHVEELIRPALFSGRHVVSDRYTASSLAYQGYGRGLPLDDVARLSEWATHGLEPDLVLLLDLSVEEARRRRSAARDRLEAEGEAFHLRVHDGFLALAADDPDRWVVIDADQPVDDVFADVLDAVAERLGLAP